MPGLRQRSNAGVRCGTTASADGSRHAQCDVDQRASAPRAEEFARLRALEAPGGVRLLRDRQTRRNRDWREREQGVSEQEALDDQSLMIWGVVVGSRAAIEPLLPLRPNRTISAVQRLLPAEIGRPRADFYRLAVIAASGAQVAGDVKSDTCVDQDVKHHFVSGFMCGLPSLGLKNS